MASKKKAIGVAVGSTLVAGMAMTPMANAADNPFALKSLHGGYMVAEAQTETPNKAPEAKCGQGKCGGGMSSASKAGEAKCGMSMMDTNKDGRISKAEFRKAHDAMFAAKDKNKNGYIDANEMNGGMEGAPPAAGKAGEAKCGQGKCGAGMMK